MTDPIALAVAFPENLDTKFLKYLGSIRDIIFSKIKKFHIVSANFSEINQKNFEVFRGI